MEYPAQASDGDHTNTTELVIDGKWPTNKRGDNFGAIQACVYVNTSNQWRYFSRGGGSAGQKELLDWPAGN